MVVLQRALSNSSLSVKSEGTSSAAEQRQLKKDLTRVERQVAKTKERLAQLTQDQESAAFEPERLNEISEEIERLSTDLQTREEEWLAITLALES